MTKYWKNQALKITSSVGESAMAEHYVTIQAFRMELEPIISSETVAWLKEQSKWLEVINSDYDWIKRLQFILVMIAHP